MLLQSVENTPVQPTDPPHPDAGSSVSDETAYREMVRETIYGYNAILRRYQENYQELISLLSLVRPSSGSRQRPSSSPSPSIDDRIMFHRTNVRPIHEGTATPTWRHGGISPVYVNLFTNEIHYDGSMNQTQCPISLDDFQEGESVLQIRGCGHVFRAEPLRRWFQSHHQCPVCRLHLYEHHGLQTPSSSNTRTTMRGTPQTIPLSSAYLGNTSMGTVGRPWITTLPLTSPPVDASGNADTTSMNALLDNFIISALTYRYDT